MASNLSEWAGKGDGFPSLGESDLNSIQFSPGNVKSKGILLGHSLNYKTRYLDLELLTLVQLHSLDGFRRRFCRGMTWHKWTTMSGATLLFFFLFSLSSLFVSLLSHEWHRGVVERLWAAARSSSARRRRRRPRPLAWPRARGGAA